MINRVNHYIKIKNYISDEDYGDIKSLEKICVNHKNINLKLELEYKLTIGGKDSNPIKAVNEFFYYVEYTLVGYLGISNFGGCDGEINGMVHPEWRRRGIFTRLYGLAKDECKRRDFHKTMLLCDEKSESALGFIRYVGAKYDFSEYKMKLNQRATYDEKHKLTIRKAKNYDNDEIGRLNSIFFGTPNIQISYPEEEEKNNRITYLFDLQGKTIGKIRVESSDETSYIYGFGILPEYRGQGYGREALTATLNLITKEAVKNIYLDVDAENSRALNLYKSCGFVEDSVTNYFVAKKSK